ncbi:hypothetical protein [Pedobacter polaris]|uniref:hypothetical protein n=1 Tax=Pedobacter polaris TaxID=2571273 RepID=UPI00145FA635|nr:hypothetical protein [Pedobacter polaris]
MESKKQNVPSVNINPVSRPSNEEIEGNIADDIDEQLSENAQPNKFQKNENQGEGVED